MSDITRDAHLNARVKHDRPDRRFIAGDGTRWGEMILPGPGENLDKRAGGMRLVAVASYPFGFLVLETIKAYERRFPERLDLVGVITDDPANRDARISLKKRIWQYYSPAERLEIETATVESGLAFGVPVYTGEVKTDWFRALLRDWRPDVIFCCGFGQLLGSVILGLPPLGAYNLHPADLAAGHGAGPAPFEDVVARGDSTTRWTLHRMNEVIDAGPIVGASPPIFVRDEAGALAEHPVQHYNKMSVGLDHMVAAALDALVGAHESGAAGPIESIDFEALLPSAIKRRMMEPLRDKRAKFPLPMPDGDLFA